MIQTLFVRDKDILSIIEPLSHINFSLYLILSCGKKFVELLWICVPRAFFLGWSSDEIFLEVLTLGIRFVMFSSVGDEVSATEFALHLHTSMILADSSVWNN